jgi:signal transduction histidine kinase
MESRPQATAEASAGEIKSLQRCINDLVSVLALPAIWTGAGPSQIVSTLIDALLAMLQLDLAYARLNDPSGGAPIEMVRVAPSRKPAPRPREIGEMIDLWLGVDPRKWPALARNFFEDREISIVPFRLGLQGEFGLIVAGSQRADFPRQTEKLLLSVAANQAAIGLQEARLRGEQKRVASELDQRVAQRTEDLAAAIEELRKEVDERKLMEEKLRMEEIELKRSEALLAESQRLSSTGSFLWRVATNEITWSEQNYRTFQIDRKTPVSIALIESRLHPEDLILFKEHVERSRRNFGAMEIDFRILLPDRSIRYLHIVGHSSRDENGQVEYTGAVQDVTERRLSEEALGKAQSELAHVARVSSLGALTASLAHEIRQPITAALTDAKTCLRWLARDCPDIAEAQEAAARMVKGVTRASDIVSSVSLLFKKGAPQRELVDVNGLIQEMIILLRGEANRYSISIRADIAENLPRVIADRVQLQQVFMNLMLNGIEAMKEKNGGGELAIKSEADDGRLVISVTDTGIGLPQEKADQIFKAFFTTKTEGTGMGLPISRSIIESHGGRLWAAPSSGRGATFQFTLPTTIAESA